MTTTQVALLTPLGRGAIASLAVEGPGALDAVAACFRPRTPHAGKKLGQLGRIVFGIWQPLGRAVASDGSLVGEELVVCRTGSQRVEVHCHGGPAAAAAIVSDLSRLGCTATAWAELASVRAAGPIRAAAMHALAQATTERAAGLLLDQYDGALEQALAQLAAALEVADRTDALERLSQLLQWAELGCHLTDPWRVVIAGAPNVGKSSLINALVGYQRSVVFDAPGTTRDVVSVQTALDGWPVELSDTAGIRASDDPLEAAGAARALAQLQQADLVVWVVELPQLTDDHIARLRHEWPTALVVGNKCDLLLPAAVTADETVERERHTGVIRTSAVTHQGVAELIDQIAQRLVPKTPTIGTAIPFVRELVTGLRDARQRVEKSDLTAALQCVRHWLPRCE